jgi:putative oxidoreductase
MTAHVSTASAVSSSIFPARRLLARVLSTSDDLAPVAARVALGAVMFPHGAQKVLGWFGGYGLSGTLGFMTGALGIPTVFAVLAIAAEFLGSIGLLTGLLSRVAAFGVAVTMAVAALMVHAKVGFFMNWAGTQGGEGFEFHLLALGLAAVVMLKGGGKYSLDRLFGCAPS